MFCVVDFLTWVDEDDQIAGIEPVRETAIIPESWLTPEKGRSYWPPQFKKTMLKMPVNSTWPNYEVEIRGTYDCYAKARIKLSKAAETDNFESAPESQERSKRKKKIPKRLENSSSESNENDSQNSLLSPPKIYSRNRKDVAKENERNCINMVDSLPKQKSNISVKKSLFLQNFSHTSMSSKKSTKTIPLKEKMKDQQCDMFDDSTSVIESSTLTSQMNHLPHEDFDNGNYEESSTIFPKTHTVKYLNPEPNLLNIPYVEGNRQVSESQPRNHIEKNSKVNEPLSSNAVKTLFSLEHSHRRHNVSPPQHLPCWSNNDMRAISAQRIQDNSYHIQTSASTNRQQSYLSDGTRAKRIFQEIIKNQEEIKAKLRNHDAMLENILMYVGNDSEQLAKPQGWPDIFPLPDIEAFMQFEYFLEKKNNFFFTVKYFALKCYSSNSCEEMTRNICRYIFSKNLKKNFNWRGTALKSGLKTKKTGSLISDAVLLKYKSSGLHIITKTISTWLRNNICSEKENNKEQNEEEDSENEYSDY